MDRPHRNWFGLIVAVGMLGAAAGCVSKNRAQAEARAAYLAGQRDALAQMQQQQNPGAFAAATSVPAATSNITIVGPVRNSVVQWRNGLTLAQAILNAVYQSPLDPAQILIKRSGEEVQVSPAQLLNGVDIPLRPGDIVLIQLPASEPD